MTRDRLPIGRTEVPVTAEMVDRAATVVSDRSVVLATLDAMGAVVVTASERATWTRSLDREVVRSTVDGVLADEFLTEAIVSALFRAAFPQD